MFLNKKKSIKVGSETDENILENIVESIKDCGGLFIREDTYQVGGQDLVLMEFKVGESKIVLEIETYEGVNLKGDREVVDKIFANMR